jgi:hypothetical protein
VQPLPPCLHPERSLNVPHRGPLLIQASRRFDAASRDLATQQPFAGCLASANYRSPYDLPLGAIIGVVIDSKRCRFVLPEFPSLGIRSQFHVPVETRPCDEPVDSSWLLCCYA